MTRAISLLLMLLAASPTGFALDPVVSKVATADLVRDALASLGYDGGGTKIAVGPWLYYWAPDFITLQAQVYVSSIEKVALQYFAVNPWTGDVWEPFGCTRILSPTLERKQEEIWRSSKLPDEARRVLRARAPGCTPREQRERGRREGAR